MKKLFTKALHDDVAASNEAKNRMTLVFAEVDKRLVDGADEHLAVLDLALRIAGILAAKK
jgi:replication factor C subunit 2/4